MNLGLLDLPAPLLELVDGGLAAVGLPALARVLLYAFASGWLCMAIYRRCSRQQELSELSTQSRALRTELAGYDGPFDGLMSRVRALLALNGRHLRLTFVPAMLAGLPLLLLMPWLSNQFGTQFPAPGSVVTIAPEQLSVAPTDLAWSDAAVRWDAESESWQLAWPATGITLRHGDRVLVTLPTAAPVNLLHPRVAWFNWLIANPGGYLPVDAPMAALHLDLPSRQLLPFGPGWLRGWLAVYLIAMVLGSLYLKWRWKLQ